MRLATLITGLFILLSSSVVHGVMSDRWYTRADFTKLGAFLDTIPNQLGDWTYRGEGSQLGDYALNELHVKSYISRNYQLPTGESVGLMLILGKPGPLSRHTPEVCYTVLGKQQLESTVEIPLAESTGSLRGLTFSPNSVAQAPFAVGYGYISTKAWSCPDVPRIALGGESFVYKVQVLTEISNDNSAVAFDTIKEFMKDLDLWIRSGTSDVLQR